MRSLILVSVLCAASCLPQGGRDGGQTVGNLVKTDHDVAGKVSILDEDTILIDNFQYDGKGFGVYIHVATQGNNLNDFVRNKILVNYPSGTQGEPISARHDGTKQLVIDLKQVGVKASSVKWLGVWCTIFNLSFGHILF